MLLTPTVVMPHRNRLGSGSGPSNTNSNSNATAGPSKKQKATAYVLKTFDQSGSSAFASERANTAAEGSSGSGSIASSNARRRSAFTSERSESGSNGSIVATAGADGAGNPAMASFSAEASDRMNASSRSGALVGHRRASSQSLTLDLDGLDLGMHGGPAEMGRPTRAEQPALPHRNQPHSSRAALSSSYAPSSSTSKEVNPLMARLAADAAQRTTAAPPSSSSRIPSELAQQQHLASGTQEDSFAAHLRECEDAHDIPTVETVLKQRSEHLSMANGVDRNGEAIPFNTAATTAGRVAPLAAGKVGGEGTGQVLGGFASLGLMGQHRPITDVLGIAGSDAEMTASTSSFGLSSSPISPVQGVEVLSPWTVLSPHECDPMGIVDILSIDEMGLHSINVGSADDWRGTSLKGSYQEQRPVATYDESLAEWLVARNVKRQRKWIVTPTNLVAARTIVVSDHVAGSAATTTDAAAGGTIHPSAFSGNASFSFRFLQAGNSAPDCTIVLATPGAHRASSDKQRQLSPAATSNLNSLSVHDEQMRSLSTMATSMQGEDGWPAMRTRANTSAVYPMDCASERRLTHSKSISTIIASSIGHHNESRRPSLGKSMSHDGLAPDASPRTHSEDAFSTPSSSNSARRSIAKLDVDGSSRDVSPRLASQLSSDGRWEATGKMTLPKESDSPFGEYAFDLAHSTASRPPAAVFDERVASPNTPMRSRVPFGAEMSPRSPSRELDSPLFDDLRAFSGQPILSSLDPARLSALQGRGGPSPTSGGTTSIGSASGSHGSSARRAVHGPTIMIPSSMPSSASMSAGSTSETYSPLSSAGSRPSGRRDKRLSEWLRRKVLPGSGGGGGSGGQSSSGTHANSSMWTPPLPPAWEPSYGFGQSGGAGPTMTATSDENDLRRTESAQSSSSSAAPASEANSVATAPCLPSYGGELDMGGVMGTRMPTGLLDQRRRSNSDDFIAAMATANRHRMQAAAAAAAVAAASSSLSPDSAAATRKGRSASGSAKLMSSPPLAPSATLLPSTLHSVSAASSVAEHESGNALDAGRRRGVSMLAMPTTSPFAQPKKLANVDMADAAATDGSTPLATSPELLGLDDVPSQAMTMVIALPLSDQSQLSVATRFLRVSFVPFAASSHADEAPAVHAEQAGSGAGHHASHNWYRRLAHAWHPTPSSVSNSGHSVCSDEDCIANTLDRSPPNGVVDGTSADGTPSREPFRIIAKMLESPTAGGVAKALSTVGEGLFGTDAAATAAAAAVFAASVDAAGGASTTTNNALLPQPFSFPVILGVSDVHGRLDLIPEGWQSIGLASGPAPVIPPPKSTAARAATAAAVAAGVLPPPHHPLRGVADLIIAGCAVCMDL